MQNHFKFALRNLRRNPGYASINIFGLALGIACCLLIGLYVQDELSYDRYHEKGDRIFRVDQRVERPGTEEMWAWAGGGMAPDLQADFQNIETVVRFIPQGGAVRYTSDADPSKSRSFQEENFYFADANVFNVFSYAFVHGDPATALQEPGSVVLTQSAARRYFGDSEPMGKTLFYEDRLPLQVRGIIEDVSLNSHLRFDLLAPVGAFKQLNNLSAGAVFDSYWWPFSYTYVLLPDAGTARQIESRLPAFITRHREDGATYIPTLEPLYDIHLRSAATGGPSAGGSLAMVRIFTAIALAILLLACINFINLATARSAKRAREVGVRKAIGAQRPQLVLQFLGESTLVSLLALAVALGLVALLLPSFNNLAAKELSVGYGQNSGFWIGLMGLMIFAGLVSGAYPALFLSSFRPVQVLKGTFVPGGRSVWLRKGLVMFQFTVSIALIAGMAVAFSQLRYMQNARLGFDKEQIVTLRLPDGEAWETLKRELHARPEVLDVTAAAPRPGLGRGLELPYEAENAVFAEGDQPRIDNMTVDYGFFEMLGLKMVAGRSFSPDLITDEGIRPDNASYFHVFDRGFILNETAAKKNGWTPDEAIGKQMRLYAYENGVYYTDVRGTVVGVVEDFHHSSLRDEIEPVVFSLAKSPYGYGVGWALMKVAPGNAARTVEALREVWNKVYPEQPFEASFLDQDLDNLYVQEASVGKIIGAFTVLGVVIACLGLLGLAAYTAEQRTKEIGVRKVLGASATSLVGLLTKDFLSLVLVATFVATPIAYFAMSRWLSDFAYRISISPLLFVGVALLALSIAFLTVGFQAYRAAHLDPVKTLRYE